MTFAPSPHLTDTRCRLGRRTRLPFARFAAALAGAALFCAPQAWAQDGEDFKRHYVSGGLLIYDTDYCQPLLDQVKEVLQGGYSASCTEAPTLNLAYGYRFTERLGIEAGRISGPGAVLIVEASGPSTRHTTEFVTNYVAATVRLGRGGYALLGRGDWDADYASYGGNGGPSTGGGTSEIYSIGYLFDIGKDKGIRLSYSTLPGPDLSFLGVEYVHPF